MVVYSDIKVLLFIFMTIAASAHAADPWLRGGMCGPKNKLADGGPGQCNPNGVHPCCGKSGWCGKTPAHCACKGCIDYRNVKPPPTTPPTTVTTTTTIPTTSQTTTRPTTTTPTPPTREPTTLEPTTLEPTTIEPTTIEATTLEATTLEPTTPEPTTTSQPPTRSTSTTTMTPVSTISLETTTPEGEIDSRDGRKLPTILHEITTTSDAAGGKADGHDMEKISTTTPASHEPHESGDAWIGLVIALCVILLIGVACLINIIRNKRKSGSQTISLTEAGVGNASQGKEKKTTVSYSNQGTLPSEERNPQITITSVQSDSGNIAAGTEASIDKVDGGKSNAAFSENQDEALTKGDTKKNQVEGGNDIIVEKDNSNDELNADFEEQTEGKGLSNDAFKEDDIVKSDG